MGGGARGSSPKRSTSILRKQGKRAGVENRAPRGACMGWISKRKNGLRPVTRQELRHRGTSINELLLHIRWALSLRKKNRTSIIWIES